MSLFQNRRGRRAPFLVVGLCSVLGGCGAAVTPPELVDARVAYKRATVSPANKLAQAELDGARTALERAEEAQRESPDQASTTDMAYIAHRKALRAESEGHAAFAEQQRALAASDTERLEKRRTEAASRAAALAAAQMEQRRALAEEKERGAISRLHGIAELTKDTRGTVITLGGGSLFAVGKATLLPAAEKRLNELAVLLSEDPTRAITVLGHTDSKGIAATNRQLSQERADALRSYLIARGVAPERVRAVGMGDSKPVADNRSAKGRAENRRIELVLEEAQAT